MPFQVTLIEEILDIFRSKPGAILSAAMGTGKTMVAFVIATRIIECKALFVVPKTTLGHWEEEHQKHLGNAFPLYVQSMKSHKKLDRQKQLN